MKQPNTLIQRSYSMLIASYWLSRCGQHHDDRSASPPSALGVKTWKEAYECFFDAMGDGRSLSQFRNSMKNARDTFDILFDNGRIGWIDAEGHTHELSRTFLQIHQEWARRDEFELQEFVLGLLSGMGEQDIDALTDRSPILRTEGGVRVFVSLRRERDSKLRAEAIRLHGQDCMACGFNFEAAYGPAGKGYIEVHHVVPLSETGRSQTDPKTDLVVLCANCHRVVHRKRGVCLSLQEIRGYVRKNTTSSPMKHQR